MEVNVLLSESAAQRSILSAKSYIQAEGILSAETPEMLADVTSSVGLTVDDAGVFQTGRKEGLYYLVGSKAFALGTVETIGSLARKRLDGKFVVWEATDDGLPGKAPVNVLTFNKWSDALRNFLGRATGSAIAAETGLAESDTAGAEASVFDSLNTAKSVKEKRAIVAQACGITGGRESKLRFETDEGSTLVQMSVPDALRDKSYGPALYSLETLTAETAKEFVISHLSLGTPILVRLSEYASVESDGDEALSKFGQVVNSGKDLFSDGVASTMAAVGPEFGYDVLVRKINELESDGYGPKSDAYLNKVLGTKGLEFHDATDSDSAALTIDGHMKDRTWFMVGTVRAAGAIARALGVKSTTDTFFATQQDGIMGDYPKLIAEFQSSEEASAALPGYLAKYQKGMFKSPVPQQTGPISLDDLVGTYTSNAPSYPTAATQASAMKKVKINADIAVTETDFDWLQDEIVKENTSGGKYEDKTPLVKSREIATFIYGKTAPVKQVLKTHVFDIKHIESGTCLTVTPIATVKAKKTGYSLVLVSRADSPKMFLNALAGAKFAIVSSQLTPAGSIKGKPELVTKVRNMREGMQYLLVGVQPEV